MKNNLKRFLLINLGIIFLSIGLHFFLVPNNLAVGGTTGLSIEISYLFPKIPVSITIFILNATLIVVGFFTIGAEFGFYTIYASFAIGIVLGILESFVPTHVFVEDDIFINLVFGIIIQAVGIGLVVNQGASTGGTDIVAKIIEKYTLLSFGKGLILSDGIVTLIAIVIYGPRLGMYAFLGAVMNSFVIDKMIAGFSTKYKVTILSDKIDEINEFIITDLYRGSTIYSAVGGYTKSEKKVISTVVGKKDYILLKNFVLKVDEKAFMYVANTSEVHGEGFTFIKTENEFIKG